MTQESMVLGVDPSLNRTGLALLNTRRELVASGVVKPREGPRCERLAQIQSQINDVLTRWIPTVAYFESPGAWQRKGGLRQETIEAMGMARGVMLAACAVHGVPVEEVNFRSVRSALIGNANAKAPEIAAYIEEMGLTIPRRPRGGTDFDVANAMLMALFGLRARDEDLSV